MPRPAPSYSTMRSAAAVDADDLAVAVGQGLARAGVGHGDVLLVPRLAVRPETVVRALAVLGGAVKGGRLRHCSSAATWGVALPGSWGSADVAVPSALPPFVAASVSSASPRVSWV